MGQVNIARQSRKSRLTEKHSGPWVSASTDFIHLAKLLYGHSATECAPRDGNCSAYVMAGIPMLFSALRCLMIELSEGVMGSSRDEETLNRLAGNGSEVEILALRFGETPIIADLRLLYEVRNEIVHCSHLPGPEPHGIPTYLIPLRDRGLLQTTATDSDYAWPGQVKSHHLFRWAFETIHAIVAELLNRYPLPNDFEAAMLKSYADFEAYAT